MKLKGISICYSALKSALCGNYVSFGVFKLYGDNHFDNVLQAFVKMLLSVSHSDLLVSARGPGGLCADCAAPPPQAGALETEPWRRSPGDGAQGWEQQQARLTLEQHRGWA